MTKHRMTDDEIRRIARSLYVEGRLTIRNLAEPATGDTRRLTAIMREVLAEAAEIPLEPDDSGEGSTFSEIPASLRGEFNHLYRSIAKAFLYVRDEENKRARQLEAAQAAQHENEVSAEREATAAARGALEEEQKTSVHRGEALAQLSADLQIKTRDLENAHAERRACSDAAVRERETMANALADAHRNLATNNTALQEAQLELSEARVELERAHAANTLLRAEAESKRLSAAETAAANEALRCELGQVEGRLEGKELEVRGLSEHMRELTRLLATMSNNSEPAGPATATQPRSATKGGKTRTK